MYPSFIDDNFLLQTDEARQLYHEFAAQEPIIDYHCHLLPAEIAEDTVFENLARIWLYGDHYKWRQMRTNGVPERFCTGNASDWEKFMAWAETVPKTLRNPLYHWTHLELRSPFGITDKVLNPDTAKAIWDECNEKLAQADYSARGIMQQMNVVLVCTTDDPTDTLEHHIAIAQDNSFTVKVCPTFRPDQGMAVESAASFNIWVDALAQSADMTISSFSDYRDALKKRHDFFHENGCRLSDHGLETAYAHEYSEREIRTLFTRLRAGGELTPEECLQFKSAMMVEFGRMDAEKGWTMQLHLGAMRNNNTRMFTALGPDTGFDSIGDFEIARPLAKFLDRLDIDDRLPRTILYNLNSRDNELFATMIGNFQDGSIPGKIQYGSAWWFLDQKDGMEAQLNSLSNLGLLSRFVGMLTDSRSFLSYPRHEYFRRILCNLFGADMHNGLVPNDFELVGGIVKNICYRNAAEYFGFEL
ncbi:MAG: glucuronate isomerase [Chitinivibrionales bacterium]|nr:glucuronate isomerase [Chitinivibrionales bacterium]